VNNEVMSAIISSPGAISLAFTDFSTEGCCDYVTVSSCNTPSSCVHQLGSYSGNKIPSQVTSNTGIMRIDWRSDSSVMSIGWTAVWTYLGEHYDCHLNHQIDRPARCYCCISFSVAAGASTCTTCQAGSYSSASGEAAL
jgi:hypothetical protein